MVISQRRNTSSSDAVAGGVGVMNGNEGHDSMGVGVA